MALRKTSFSKKERQCKIQALQRNNGHISNNDIRVLLQEVDDGDDDTALLLLDLEDLAGLEQQYSRTRKENRRVKDTIPQRNQFAFKQTKPQTTYKHSEKKNVRKSRHKIERSVSSKLQLPHPPWYIPHQSLIPNTRTNNNNTPTPVCSKSSLPPIPHTTSGCQQCSHMGQRCHGNNKNQKKEYGSLLTAKFDFEKSNLIRSRENKTMQENLMTKTCLPPIASARNVTLSETDKGDVHIGVHTKKDVKGNKRYICNSVISIVSI